MERSRFTVLVVLIAVVAGVTIGLSPFASRGEEELPDRVRADRSEDTSPADVSDGDSWQPPARPHSTTAPAPETGSSSPDRPVTEVLGVTALRSPLDLLRRRAPRPARVEEPVADGWRWFLGDEVPRVTETVPGSTAAAAPVPPWFADPPPATNPPTTTRPTTPPTAPPTAPPTTAAPTTEPPVTTEPEVTTTLPEVTTTLPEVTTTLPEVTTTLPEVPPDPVIELPLPFGLGVDIALDLV